MTDAAKEVIERVEAEEKAASKARNAASKEAAEVN